MYRASASNYFEFKSIIPVYKMTIELLPKQRQKEEGKEKEGGGEGETEREKKTTTTTMF